MEQKLPLEKELEPIFLGKFPAFPDNIKEIIVQFGPYLIIIGLIFGGLALLAAFGLGSLVAGLGATAYGSGMNYWVAMGVLGVTFVLELLALPHLFKRRKQGWNLMYFVQWANLIGSLLTLSILGLVIGAVLGFWILFQIREKYS